MGSPNKSRKLEVANRRSCDGQRLFHLRPLTQHRILG